MQKDFIRNSLSHFGGDASETDEMRAFPLSLLQDRQWSIEFSIYIAHTILTTFFEDLSNSNLWNICPIRFLVCPDLTRIYKNL
jgi:hypothetical protein